MLFLYVIILFYLFCVGFVVDLARHISDFIRFDYKFVLVPDVNYGSRVNGTWDGMVGELVSGVTTLV